VKAKTIRISDGALWSAGLAANVKRIAARFDKLLNTYNAPTPEIRVPFVDGRGCTIEARVTIDGGYDNEDRRCDAAIEQALERARVIGQESAAS